MKVGCAIWCFNPTGYKAPYDNALLEVVNAGFKGIEIIAGQKEELDEYFTNTRIDDWKKVLDKNSVEVSEFVVFQDLIRGLSSFNKDEKNKALECIEKGAKIAQRFGTKNVCIVSNYVEGLTPLTRVASQAIYTNVNGLQSPFNPKLYIGLPKGDFWDAAWENYVASIKKCCQIVGAYGLNLAIEGHPNAIISNADASLRLFEHVKEPNIGENFDTTWHMVSREYVPMVIRKLKNRLLHLHVRDCDGLLSYGIPAGLGIIDWEEVIESLKIINYNGFLSIEFGGEKYIKQSKKYLEDIIAEH